MTSVVTQSQRAVTDRSFCPYWQLLRTFIEKMANVHQQLVTSWQEEFKEVQKYAIEQQKTHKEVICWFVFNNTTQK